MHLIWCLSAAWVGWMFSRILDVWVNSYFLTSFNSMMSLVRKYMSTANRFRSNFIPSLTSLGIHRGSLKTSFTSGKDFKVKGSFRSIATECRECNIQWTIETQRESDIVFYSGKHLASTWKEPLFFWRLFPLLSRLSFYACLLVCIQI